MFEYVQKAAFMGIGAGAVTLDGVPLPPLGYDHLRKSRPRSRN